MMICYFKLLFTLSLPLCLSCGREHWSSTGCENLVVLRIDLPVVNLSLTIMQTSTVYAEPLLFDFSQ